MDETLTELLDAAGKGDDDAQGRVFALLYDELRRLEFFWPGREHT